MDNVFVLKLVTGQEVVGQIVDENKESPFLTIKNPVTFVVQQQGAESRLTMQPFMFLSNDEHFEIRKDHIMLIGSVLPDILSGYEQQFGIISTPPKQLII